jgi:hypothetical protein
VYITTEKNQCGYASTHMNKCLQEEERMSSAREVIKEYAYRVHTP